MCDSLLQCGDKLFHISSYAALNSSAVDCFLILVFSTYFGVELKGSEASK